MPRARFGLALVACGLLLGGCDSPAGPGERAPLSVIVAGRLERGSTIHVSAARGDVALSPANVTYSFDPADAVQPLGGDSVRLVRAGTVSVVVTVKGESATQALAVAVPPSIVFDRVANGNRDIWRVALDGGELTQITTDLADDLDPTVAAGRLVFVSFRADRNAELFSMPLAGGAATRITTSATNESAPALSRDGSRLAYALDVAGVTKLFRAAGDGSGRAQALASSAEAVESSPSWAPADGSLVFMSTVNGTADLFELPLAGTATQLVGGNSADVEPAVSGDGRFVAFASTRSGNDGADIFVLRRSDGQIVRLTNRAASEGQPAWTADGRLVYTEFGADGGRLRWVDPAAPGVIHEIDTGAGSARNPSSIP
ncbi:MAG TPA: hypothetical protein VF647_02295 [Longimicrobium sp.]